MYRLLGTPNETIWPGVSQHRDWHEFPQWRPQELSLAVPGLCAVGLDLLAVSFLYGTPKSRSFSEVVSFLHCVLTSMVRISNADFELSAEDVGV